MEEQRKDLLEAHEAREGLTEGLKELRVKLAEAERQQERATAEAVRQKELLEVSERNAATLEAQLTVATDAHRSAPAESRQAHHEELNAFRSDYRDVQKQARETAAELSEARATIRHLQERLTPESQDHP